MSKQSSARGRRTLLWSGLLAVGYVLAGSLGLELDAVSGFAALVWAPTGLAIAALTLVGPGAWGGVAVGALTVNLLEGATPAVAAGIAVGNTLEAVVGAHLLRRSRFRPDLGRVRDA